MFNTLYILQWDNYYDRRVHPDLVNYDDGGYGIYLEMDTAGFSGVNFNPNDGVNTEVILNFNESQKGNYLIVLNEDNRIISRWFIIDENRVRGNQYKLTLHRDVITDYWNIIKSSPALIEKCNLQFNNPLIFNNEDMTVNQIKTSERLLKDISGCPWLVAYIAKDATQGLTGTAKVGSDLESSAINIGTTIENWEAENSTFYGSYTGLQYHLYYKTNDTYYYTFNAYSGDSGGELGGSTTHTKNTSISLTTLTSGDDATAAMTKSLKNVGLENCLAVVPAYTTDVHTAGEIEDYLNLNGKVIVDTNGKYYRVKIEEVKSQSKVYDVPSGSLFNYLKEAVNNATYKFFGQTRKAFSGTPNEYTFRLKATYNTFKTTLTPLVNMEVNYTVSSNRVSTADASYDILAIPYGEILAIAEIGQPAIRTNAEIGLAVLQAISKNLSESCYDIQLVPYCPLQDYITAEGTIATIENSGLTSFITKDEDKIGVIYYVPNANFTFNILESVQSAQTSIQRKINNDCDKWRLCSPNYSNYFDFSVEKNGGVQYFNVDCCYKPYSPYIHINPNFNNLYGQDFNDPRGLVCGGDFSLSQVRSAWESYQLQNKNFQATFDRQIQNMEITNKYQKMADITSAIAGTVQGGVSGAATGLFASGGNPYAAIGGAIGGVVVSGVAGIADVTINERLRNEALDYTRDQFGYNLGNIQAIPLTLTKVSAFNDNNKIFPVLEYYTCTDREKEAYAYKIAYNGMTNMTIGTIEDNITSSWEIEINNKTIKSQNYIKAKPIQLLLGEDFHVANTIAKEMNMGFYIVEEEE